MSRGCAITWDAPVSRERPSPLILNLAMLNHFWTVSEGFLQAEARRRP